MITGRSFSIFAALMLLSVFVNPVLAGKLYKWVDSEGNVSYSQVPPPEDEKVKQEKVVNVSVASNAAQVTRHGNYEYCGDLKLPGPLSDTERLYREMHGKREYWERRLKDAQSSLQRSINSKYKSYKQNRDRWTKQISELKCALSWELTKREQLKDIEQNISQKFKQAQLSYDRLNEAAYDDCGPEPVLADDIQVYESSKKRWRACMKKHNRLLKNAKSNLRRAENDFELLR